MADLPAFDPSADFVAALPIRYRGKALMAGAPIDKSLAGDTEDKQTRVLRIMYENHRIIVATPKADVEQSQDEKDAGVAPLDDTQKARVADLVANNSRADLDALAADDQHKVADPGKLPSKEAVATAIVRAEASAAA